MKKLVIIVFCLIGVMCLSACSGKNEALDKIKERKKIIITTSADYPPFEFVDLTKSGQDKYVGSDIELMKYIASNLDVSLEIYPADFNSTLAFLKSGVCDLAISGYTYTEERSKNYLFSKAYDSEGSQGVLVLKSKYDLYKNLNDINKGGNKVIAQSGSLQAGYVLEYLKNTVLVQTTTIAEGLTILKNDSQAVAIAIASTTALSIMDSHPNEYVFLEETFPVDPKENDLFVIANKGEKDLINEVNKIIDEILEKNLYKQWLEEAKELAIILGAN